MIGNGLLVTALGIPVYLVGVYWQKKPPIFHKIMGKLLFEIYLDWDYFHSKMVFFSRFPEYQHSKDVYGCKGRVKDVCDPSFDNVNFNYSDQIKIDCLD